MDKKTLLVVDDSKEILDIIRNVLSNDYSLKMVPRGDFAIKIATSDDPPDLILLDIIMPDMDGYEVCRQIKANKKSQNIPIIFLTGQDFVLDGAKGFMLGAVDFILKPINPTILRVRIKNQLMIDDRLKERIKEFEDEVKSLKEKILFLESKVP